MILASIALIVSFSIALYAIVAGAYQFMEE